jgi:hypothetical protein
VITVRIGQLLPVQAQFSGTVSGPGGPDGLSVNALHTLDFTLDPIGDFSYVTASGNTYFTPAAGDASPVPEPATLTLFGSGLLIGGIVVRRKRRASAI